MKNNSNLEVKEKAMAIYTLETVSNDIRHYENVSEFGMKLNILNINKVYAEGSDIDFEGFLSYSYHKTLLCQIQNSEIENVLINSSRLLEIRHNVHFINCNIKQITIIDLDTKILNFQQCTIGKLTIKNNGKLINSLSLSDNTTLENLEVESCKLHKFKLDNIKLKTIQIRKTYVGTLEIDSSVINTFRISGQEPLISLSFSKSNIENFLSEIDICSNKATHDSKFYMNECKGKYEFRICEIEPDIKVIGCSINLIFYKVRTYSKRIFDFSGSQKSKIEIVRCYFEKEVQFNGDLCSNTKNLILDETVFKDLVLFDDDHSKSLIIKETHFQNGLLLPIVNIEKSTEVGSTVWCILKNQALSRNENINAFEYRKKELLSYSKEIKNDKHKRQERFVLCLNWLSNKHGISWLQGILFTLGSWIVFFSLFTMSKDGFYCLFHRGCNFMFFDKTFWSEAINFLWIPEGLNDISLSLM